MEGVASVTATGALEESIQVTMNQEKIDALNGKILAAIDEQFEEAQQELDDASEEIENGKKKLDDGKDALAEQLSGAQNEVENGKLQAYVGESELRTNLMMMTQAKAVLAVISGMDGAIAAPVASTMASVTSGAPRLRRERAPSTSIVSISSRCDCLIRSRRVAVSGGPASITFPGITTRAVTSRPSDVRPSPVERISAVRRFVR